MSNNQNQMLRHVKQLAKKTVTVTKEYGVTYAVQKITQKVAFHVLKPRLLRKPLFTPEQLDQQKRDEFPRDVTFSIIVPLYNTPENFLREMIESVQAQTYGKWELCLADGSTPEFSYVETISQEYAAADSRIRYRKLEKNLGISGNTNACLELATGNYIALFDHDDLLHPAALHQVMEAICWEDADYVYTDEAIFIGSLSHLYAVHCKNEYSRDILLSNNYICHLSVFSREVLEKAGPFYPEFDGSQDHDFILRATEQAKKIVHIPQILYYWRSHPNSVASDISSKTYAIQAGINAVKTGLSRQGIDAKVESSPVFPTIYRIRYPMTEEPKVSVVVPSQTVAEAAVCVQALLEQTDYENLEVLVVLPQGTEVPQSLKDADKVRVVLAPDAAQLHNCGAEQAQGDYLAFVSSGTFRFEADWIRELLVYAQREDAGAVGAKVFDERNRIYTSGLFLNYQNKIVECAFRGKVADSDGYMGRLFFAAPYAAVARDCMMIRSDLFRRVQGFSTGYTGDLAAADLCLKLQKQGKTNLWNPYAVVQLRRPSQKTAAAEKNQQVQSFRLKWRDALAAGDPYNSRVSLDFMEDFLGNTNR